MGTELATIPGLPLPSRVNSPTPDSDSDSSIDTDLLLPLLPTEIVEMILDHLWRFEDQLSCRKVCKWWRSYIPLIRRDPATHLPLNYYSFSPQGWTCLGPDQEPIRQLEFRSCGRATLREYNPLTHALVRELKYEPNKEKAREVIHDDFKRIHTIWHFNTHETKNWTEFRRTECAIL